MTVTVPFDVFAVAVAPAGCDTSVSDDRFGVPASFKSTGTTTEVPARALAESAAASTKVTRVERRETLSAGLESVSAPETVAVASFTSGETSPAMPTVPVTVRRTRPPRRRLGTSTSSSPVGAVPEAGTGQTLPAPVATQLQATPVTAAGTASVTRTSRASTPEARCVTSRFQVID